MSLHHPKGLARALSYVSNQGTPSPLSDCRTPGQAPLVSHPLGTLPGHRHVCVLVLHLQVSFLFPLPGPAALPVLCCAVITLLRHLAAGWPLPALLSPLLVVLLQVPQPAGMGGHPPCQPDTVWTAPRKEVCCGEKIL